MIDFCTIPGRLKALRLSRELLEVAGTPGLAPHVHSALVLASGALIDLATKSFAGDMEVVPGPDMTACRPTPPIAAEPADAATDVHPVGMGLVGEDQLRAALESQRRRAAERDLASSYTRLDGTDPGEVAS